MISRLFQKDALTAAGGWLESEETDLTPAGPLHLSGYPCASLNLPAPCDKARGTDREPQSLLPGHFFSATPPARDPGPPGCLISGLLLKAHICGA